MEKRAGSRLMAFGGKPLVRLLDHFACSGGTIFSKAISAMPNTYMLSEIEPYSAHAAVLAGPRFGPTDVLQKLRHQIRPVAPSLIGDVYLKSIEALVHGLGKSGGHLVIRGHAHSLYCLPKIQEDPSNREILERNFQVASLLTVRNPIYSFVSLRHNGWEDFNPKGVGEYAKRYHRFLDDNRDSKIFKYEDFVDDPAGVLEAACDQLRLPFNPDSVYFLADVHLTGDSGRIGALLKPRQPRPVPRGVAENMRKSKNFRSLMERLGYKFSK